MKNNDRYFIERQCMTIIRQQSQFFWNFLTAPRSIGQRACHNDLLRLEELYYNDSHSIGFGAFVWL